MPTVSGVTFDSTSGGKLDEANIPTEGFGPHYLYPGDTKSDSSYPQVDADGSLRRGNVEAAWSLGARGGVDEDEHKAKVKRLGKQFDSNPLPDDAYDQDMNDFSGHDTKWSVGDWVKRDWSGGMVHGKVRDTTMDSFTVDGNTISGDDDEQVVKMEQYDRDAGEFTGQNVAAPASGVNSWSGPSQDNALDIGADLSMAANAVQDVTAASLSNDYNTYGVREETNSEGDLEYIEVVFEAMEPGPPEDRNGVRITEDFLRDVAAKEYPTDPPHLVDHSRQDSFAKVGDVKDVWFSESRSKLMLKARVPNTGTQTHDEAIKRYTHEPPSWREGSVGFGRQYEAVENDAGEPELVDATLREFSAVNFPGGYDEGGLRAAFADAARDAVTTEPATPGELTARLLAADFEVDSDELDEVYSKWSDAVNMTASQLERWADHPCADTASNKPETVRKRNLRLLEKGKSEWTEEDITDANRTINFISRMGGQKPDSPADGGKGTCPSEWAVSMLNWAYNPFDGMPDGTPNPEENSIHTTTMEFAGHEGDGDSGQMSPEMEELSQVYEAYEGITNMTEDQMERWGDHPCSDKLNETGEDHRDNFMMLAGQPMEEWGQEAMEVANRVIDYAMEAMDDAPENPQVGGPGTCPSRWAIQLLNRGHNPFDGFPSGNPQFEDIEVEVVTFDDEADTSENLATDGDAVETETIQF